MIKLKAARQALASAFAFGLSSPPPITELMTVVQCSPKGNLDTIVTGPLLSTIIGEVERQPIVIKSWLKLTYGVWDPKGVEAMIYRDNVENWLHNAFWECHTEQEKQEIFRRPTEARQRLISKMVGPGIDEGMARSMAARAKYSPSEVQAAISADSNTIKNWTRDCAPMWEQLVTLMNELDKTALQPIARVVRKINEEFPCARESGKKIAKP